MLYTTCLCQTLSETMLMHFMITKSNISVTILLYDKSNGLNLKPAKSQRSALESAQSDHTCEESNGP